MYVAWNAMCISAYLEAGRALDLPEVRAFALKSLDRVLADGDGAKRDWRMWWRTARMAQERAVPGVLDDYVFLGNAALDAWEATGEMRYYNAAEPIGRALLGRFYDATGAASSTRKRPRPRAHAGSAGDAAQAVAGFADAGGQPFGSDPADAAGRVERPAGLLVKRQETLETFAGVVEHFGLYAATYALALQRMVRALQVCVIGEAAAQGP